MTDDSVSMVRPGKTVPGTRAEEEIQHWNRELENFRDERLERVQASARVWLGVLTTLVGLLGSVVLFKGGGLITGLTASVPFQAALILLVALVFGVTVLALILCGHATWGGLKDPTQPAGYKEVIARETGAERRWKWLWLRFAELLAREAASKERGSEESKPAWQVYKEWNRRSADLRRLYLHASRTAGRIAAVLIAVLAIVAVIAGTASPAPANVIVVHHGQLTCGPVSESHGLTGVTQVVTVSNC